MSKEQWGHGYFTGKGIKDSIVHKWFHTFKDGQIHRQGQILDKPTDKQYLIQLYSFLDGGATYQELINVDDMKDWKFYNSDKEMRLAYSKERLKDNRDKILKKINKTSKLPPKSE